MATPNFTQIAKDFPNVKDGFVELERQLTRVPSASEGASLAGAYANLKMASSSSNKSSSSSSTDNRSYSSGRMGLLQSQMTTSQLSELKATESVDLSKYTDDLKNIKPLSAVKESYIDILRQLNNENQLRTDINEKIGVTGVLSQSLRNTIIESTSNAMQFGFGMSDIKDMMSEMVGVSGRFNFISKETIDKSYGTARAFVGSLGDLGKLMGEFEKIGLGASGTIKEIDKAGTSSVALGLNVKKTTDLLKSNIEELNRFGFKNGVQGLNSMVQKSIEFRMNMSEVFKIADTVMDPDKAISLSANLAVLGGAMGDFGNPLKMMYDATNNVEGLQDSLIEAAGSLATYNQEQGRFEITGVNLRRAQAMAKELGIEYKELAKGAIAAQERMASNDILLSKGFNLKEKDREFISNLTQMKDGKLVVSIPEDVAKGIGVAAETALTDLTQPQIDSLIKNQKDLAQMNPEQIAKDQFTLVKNISNNVQAIVNRQIRGVTTDIQNNPVSGTNNKTSVFGQLNDYMNQFAKIELGKSQSELQEMVDEIKSGTGEIAKSLGLDATSIKELRDYVDNEMKQKLNDLKASAEKQKEKEKESKEDRRGAYNPNTILKSQIDVRFPFGFGTPTANVKNSYLDIA
jgi:hypothetical protein